MGPRVLGSMKWLLFAATSPDFSTAMLNKLASILLGQLTLGFTHSVNPSSSLSNHDLRLADALDSDKSAVH